MLYYNTVNNLLKDSLIRLMNAAEFKNFRLVGGTALSLQLGHRQSIDIDLFSDLEYGKIDFESIDKYFDKTFNYVDYFKINPAMGKSYLVGTDKDNTLKLDVYYTDNFIYPEFIKDTIRMATIEEIIAMKLDVIQRGGRKKDFWDLHQLFDSHTLSQMLEYHEKRYPYSHDRNLIIQNFTDFRIADEEFDPICLKGKYWEFIKEDIEDILSNSNY